MKSLAVLSGIFLSLFAAVPAFAFQRSYETEVINNVSIGDISIDLAVYEDDGPEGEAGYQNSGMVLPGQTVSRIVQITNLANPAWVRVRLEFLADEDIFSFPESFITPADERWVWRGGAWYYTSPLGKGEKVDFMKELRIPTFWGDELAGCDFTLVITAEAVQEANFDPDFDSQDPWFGTLIETCVHTACEPAPPRQGTFTVSFEGGAEGLVKTGDDFFENFGSLMPGDDVSDVLRLKNDYSKPVTIYFRSEGPADDILARMVKLTISGGEGLIFDGSISQSRDEIKIATLRKGEEENITYSLFIPPEADNAFALIKTSDKWIFRAESGTEKKTSSSGGKSGKTVSDVTPGQGPSPAAQFVYPVRELAQTGEGGAVILAAALMFMAGLILLIIRGGAS